ncbi:hypothetical protein MBM_10015 [Drepanopeziza brunnea f. sp. 'multigermtubi' MB_m1]|uniref:Uncharacterized protein n=1 Tax=Marssonina brunnea f. sp. multigermtubi (strain MB_m1) TaxID=1072389 RepID=K1WG56_MARBU|nr:uncharacterized protein MBM_10015 [Drepanopeziza brunnea f. sp. 'multigermtubi' MB_m1]EKD11821.1 hypothetical protein MBM_10015 [Drepanopeziza brunnea f. sp. 'multigermtubi' MB_m1]
MSRESYLPEDLLPVAQRQELQRLHLKPKVLTKRPPKDASEDAPSQEERDKTASDVDRLKTRREALSGTILPRWESLQTRWKTHTSRLRWGGERGCSGHDEGQGEKIRPCEVQEGCSGATLREKNGPVGAAYLVPWLLNGGDLDYLFGITDGSAILSDSADAISLHTRIESALDNAEIVIVPRLEAGKETEWEVFVTDESELGDAACLTAESGQTKCKVLLKRNEPGSMKWVKNLEATPGPDLRKSMLMALARKVSDKYPPPGLVDANTFDELPYDPP